MDKQTKPKKSIAKKVAVPKSPVPSKKVAPTKKVESGTIYFHGSSSAPRTKKKK